ncbi:glycosyltransferase [Ferruginibacter albus]|uniref:glycosyltransferase n=1 Tax=Ferruginibacter albus TaxID=2875540 RepID=UPI001CC6D86E|nr:glycosyltransferase [Ferruginibacter albus]UAY53396.1 glycosyltransferase [Ferruginibacter albus]
MPDKHLHIVAHTVPFPADIGGVIDLFYKIKALHKAGIKIHLHCFTYANRTEQPELNKYCEKVHYYKRHRNIFSASLRLPFIVSSRKSKELLSRLQQDNYPILFEGIHTTYYLQAGKLKNRKTIVRLHNAEFEYYHRLSLHEHNLLKKVYFQFESRLLKKYENKLAKKYFVVAVSEHDVQLYQDLFHAINIQYMPVFLPYSLAVGKEGKGCYCLYHGNLSVNENEKAAIWLLQNVFTDKTVPFIIAGKDPSEALRCKINQHNNCCLVANPTEKEMQDIIRKAQINILPSFNNTGVKLKLINALFNGRHCVVNTAGVEGSGLENACHIAEDKDEFKSAIEQLYQQPFTEEEIQQRQGILQALYNNEANAQQLIKWLW